MKDKDQILLEQAYKTIKEAFTVDNSGTLQGIPDDIADAEDPTRAMDQSYRDRPVATSKLAQRTNMDWQPQSLREYQKELMDIVNGPEPFDEAGGSDVAGENQEQVVKAIENMIKTLEQLKDDAANVDVEEDYDGLLAVIERLT